MITLTRSKFQSGSDVLGLEHRVVLENFIAVGASREKIEDVPHANTQVAQGGPSAALFRIYRNSVKLRHGLFLRPYGDSLQ